MRKSTKRRSSAAVHVEPLRVGAAALGWVRWQDKDNKMRRLYDLIEREQTPGGKCPHCGTTQGFITLVGTQSVLRCNGCERHLYNPPKSETGDKPRTLSTTHAAIKPKQRMRIIERANGRCETCGSRSLLQVGHVVSVADGHKLGMTDAILNSDENLICQCAECNTGQGRGTIPLRMYCAILRARAEAN